MWIVTWPPAPGAICTPATAWATCAAGAGAVACGAAEPLEGGCEAAAAPGAGPVAASAESPSAAGAAGIELPALASAWGTAGGGASWPAGAAVAMAAVSGAAALLSAAPAFGGAAEAELAASASTPPVSALSPGAPPKPSAPSGGAATTGGVSRLTVGAIASGEAACAVARRAFAAAERPDAAPPAGAGGAGLPAICGNAAGRVGVAMLTGTSAVPGRRPGTDPGIGPPIPVCWAPAANASNAWNRCAGVEGAAVPGMRPPVAGAAVPPVGDLALL